jgi:ADP-dependent NAD(P)H-hydrate dehydratase / NAD(P)H-hydrate epimerase
MKVSRADEMRAMDRTAIEQFGIPAELLMENAGHAAYSALSREFDIPGMRFLIVCGRGNNGGDGFVLARKIHANGGIVHVVIIAEPAQYQGSAKMNFEILSRLPIEIIRWDRFKAEYDNNQAYDLIVDSIFGTGLSRDVEGRYLEVIDWVNASDIPVLSIDIPSGVHGDTGQIMGAAVKAAFTVTFGLPKLGNILYPGYELCGKLYVSHISFPPSLYQSDALKIEINQPVPIPLRNMAGHKGTFGKLLTIGGAVDDVEAPYFSALSFLKCGGGYSCLAAPRSITPFIASKGSEIVIVPQEETASGSISLDNKDSLLQLIEDMDLVILGPGLSLQDETQRLACEIAMQISKPLLIDGDGITALCSNAEIFQKRKSGTILTPHLAEMSRLTNIHLDEIETRKVEILQKTAESLNAIIVLKGAHSIIGFPNQRVAINMSGSSGMAMVGSGDVLNGAIAAMFALGLPLEAAVRQGVFTRGLAEYLAAREIGEDGLTAQDILDHLPLAVKKCRDGLNEDLSHQYRGALRV